MSFTLETFEDSLEVTATGDLMKPIVTGLHGATILVAPAPKNQ